MSRKFKHLSLQQRLVIGFLLNKGVSKAAIAKEIQVHRSTIYRELARNTDNEYGYHILLAQEKAKQRQYEYKKHKLVKDPYLKQEVIERLKQGWSPQQIAGRLKYLYGTWRYICYEAIYNYIYSTYAKAEKLYHYLRRRLPKRFPKGSRKKRSIIPNRTCITERPTYINDLSECGHWEADFMVFGKGTKASLMTLRERKSRYIIAIKNDNRQANQVAQRCMQHLMFLKHTVKSFTFDNDLGFARHEQLAQHFHANTYFCEPYKSWQKGCVENGNNLLRQYFPRHVGIEPLDQNYINKVVLELNFRPLKCLNYRTPEEVFYDFEKVQRTISNNN